MWVLPAGGRASLGGVRGALASEDKKRTALQERETHGCCAILTQPMVTVDRGLIRDSCVQHSLSTMDTIMIGN
uniref:Uncharacterized protein n=1 Tax=Knipowitschia caucasica TaxID=637954 RepID=A0AAV2K437_KNICA